MALRGTLTHRKTRRLARLLGIPLPCALGVFEALLHVTADRAPDGAIGRLSNEDIAEEMFWDGPADALIAAFVEAGNLDERDDCRLYVHDWHEHADDSIQVRLARHGRRFANGSLPSMRRLERAERDRILRTYAQEDAETATKAPSSSGVRFCAHRSAPPEPVPEPRQSHAMPEPGTPNMADLQPASALEVEQASEPETEPPEPERPPPKAEPWQPLWESFLALYPRRSGDRGVKAGREVFGRLLKAGKAEAEALLRGVRAYRAWADDTGKTGTELVKQIPTWLHGECWQEDWSGRPPARASPNGSGKREESLAEQRDRLLATIRTGREGDLFGVKGGGDADG